MSKRLIPIRDLSSKMKKAPNAEDLIEQKNREAVSKKEEAENVLEKSRREAGELLNEAREQVRKEKEEWENEKKELVEEAKVQGYKEGFEKGTTEGRSEYESLISEANETIAGAEATFREKIQGAEEEILHIAMRAGKRILGHSLEEDPSQFRFIVAEAIREVADQPVVSIYVHPNFYEELNSYREELSAGMDTEAQLSVFVRNFEDPYQCFIETPFGRIDASIDSQFELIRKAILDVVKEGI